MSLKPTGPLDRSAMFTALLELDPEFRSMPMQEGMERITEALADWQESESTDMFAFAKQWVAKRQEETHV